MMPDYRRYLVAFVAVKRAEQGGVTTHSTMDVLDIAGDIADTATQRELLIHAYRVFSPSDGFMGHGFVVHPSETIRKWLDRPMTQ